MTDYNKKLKELIKEAADHGYTFGSDNEFHKEPEYVYVMEMFWIWNSVYEETGEYYIYKHTFKITNEEYNRMVDFGKKNDMKAICCDHLSENGICDIADDIIYKYDTSDIDFLNGFDGSIDVQYRNDYYNRYTKEYDAECVDLWFSKKDDNSDFPRGYISFYQMQLQDYENSQSIDLEVRKFLKDN